MELGLAGKAAIVTGGSKGIGFAVARGLAAEGCAVTLVARDGVALARARDAISADHAVDVRTHACDLSDSTSIPVLLETAGVPDILVNNAGAIPAGDLQAVDEARWREAWDLKVFGYINMTRTFYDAMRGRDGVIINVTGLAAERTDAGYVAGTTGNAGLNAFTRAVGSRSLEDGLRVLAVSPGAVETERLVGLMRTRAEAEKGSPDRWQDYFAGLPLSRPASPAEVADVVVFAASQRAAYLSGIVITVDGGHGARMGSFT